MSAAREISSSRLIVAREKSVRKNSRASYPRTPQGAPGVVEQVQQAFKPKARLATLLGCLLGGFVPLASYVLAHYVAADTAASHLERIVAAALVAGGLRFSAATVYEWGKLAFQAGGKALGFVVLLEGVMVGCPIQWLSLTALGYLIGINAIATGCTLSLKTRPT